MLATSFAIVWSWDMIGARASCKSCAVIALILVIDAAARLNQQQLRSDYGTSGWQQLAGAATASEQGPNGYFTGIFMSMHESSRARAESVRAVGDK